MAWITMVTGEMGIHRDQLISDNNVKVELVKPTCHELVRNGGKRNQGGGYYCCFNLSSWVNYDVIYEMENSVERTSLGAQIKNSVLDMLSMKCLLNLKKKYQGGS